MVCALVVNSVLRIAWCGAILWINCRHFAWRLNFWVQWNLVQPDADNPGTSPSGYPDIRNVNILIRPDTYTGDQGVRTNETPYRDLYRIIVLRSVALPSITRPYNLIMFTLLLSIQRPIIENTARIAKRAAKWQRTPHKHTTNTRCNREICATSQLSINRLEAEFLYPGRFLVQTCIPLPYSRSLILSRCVLYQTYLAYFVFIVILWNPVFLPKLQIRCGLYIVRGIHCSLICRCTFCRYSRYSRRTPSLTQTAALLKYGIFLYWLCNSRYPPRKIVAVRCRQSHVFLLCNTSRDQYTLRRTHIFVRHKCNVRTLSHWANPSLLKRAVNKQEATAACVTTHITTGIRA